MTKNFNTFTAEQTDNVTESMVTNPVISSEQVFTKPEPKNRRVNILVRQSLYDRMKKRTDREYISMNEQINQYIDEELKKRGY